MAIDYLQGARLQFVGLHYETSLYELHGPQFTPSPRSASCSPARAATWTS